MWVVLPSSEPDFSHGERMKYIGYLIIIWSAINLMINIPRFISMQKSKREAKRALGGESNEFVDAFFGRYAEYDGGLIVMSFGALLIGFYLVVNGASVWQFIGLILLFMSLSGLVQSFRPLETESLLEQSGDCLTPVNRVAARLRITSAIEFVVGLYLVL